MFLHDTNKRCRLQTEMPSGMELCGKFFAEFTHYLQLYQIFSQIPSIMIDLKPQNWANIEHKLHYFRC